MRGKSLIIEHCTIAIVCSGWVVFAWPECRYAYCVGCKIWFQGHGTSFAWGSQLEPEFWRLEVHLG